MTPRLATALMFVLNGAVVGTWVAQIPWIAGQLGATRTEIGIVLLCTAAGALVSMPLTGQALARVSSRRVVTVGALLYPLLAPVPSIAPSLPILALSMIVFGFVNGILDVGMNAHGVAVERQMRRPVMSSLHAGWSIGGLLGSAGVAAAIALGVDPRLEAAGVMLLLLGLALVAIPRLGPGSTGTGSATRIVLPGRAVLPLGLIAVVAALVEGGLSDWSGLYLQRDLRADPGVAAAGYAAFALGMAVGRLGGDAANRRLGAPSLLGGGMLLVALAVGAFLAVGQPFAAIVGLAAAGIGVANAIPLLFSAAGRVPPSGPSLSAVFTMAYTGFLAGPPVMGFIADQVGLPVALAGVAVLALVVVLVASRAPGVAHAHEHG